MAAGWSAANRAAGKTMTITQLRVFRYKGLIIFPFLERNLWTMVTRRDAAYKCERADVAVPEELIVNLVTVSSESYPPELLSVNAFRASGAVFGGKLLCQSVALRHGRAILTNAIGQRRSTTKASAIRCHRRAIFLSESCDGILAVFAEWAIFGVILFRQKRSLRIALVLAAFVVVLVSVLARLGGKELTSKVVSISQEARWGDLGRGASPRSTGTASACLAIGHFWGLGTFPVVYP